MYRSVSRNGSGANARVAGDDEEMQRFVPIEDLFKGRHFDRQIIVFCVSWYTSFKLSLRDLVIMMADRGTMPRVAKRSVFGKSLWTGGQETQIIQCCLHFCIAEHYSFQHERNHCSRRRRL